MFLKLLQNIGLNCKGWEGSFMGKIKRIEKLLAQ